MIMQWSNEDKNEVIRRLAYCIYQQRKRCGAPDADNERKNWLRAKQCLYPEEMTVEELNYIGG